MFGWRASGVVSSVALAGILSTALAGCGSDAPVAKTADSYGGYNQPTAQGYAPGQPGRSGWFDAPNTAPAPPAASAWSGGDAPEAAQSEARSRPGLGTEWGETMNSRITSTAFLRADASSPFAMASMFYNDASGARAMANAAGSPTATSGTFSASGGLVSMGLRDENGHFLSGWVSGGKNYVVGEAGTRYTIVLRNRSPFRFEVVMSVDGLDVIDGKEGSLTKRGYILDPRGELEVEGFRQSIDQVAAFRFGSVSGSYANQKHSETRNVGVIGVALFHERGSDPSSWNDSEVDKRHNANPFPGTFATPP